MMATLLVADWRQAGIGYTAGPVMMATLLVADWRQAGIGYTTQVSATVEVALRIGGRPGLVTLLSLLTGC